MSKNTLLKSIVKEIISEIKRPVKEAVTKVNLEQPASNLFIKGWGMDKSGNFRVVVGFPNDKGFPIQTNGNLPKSHVILKNKSAKDLTGDDLATVGKEITAYVKKYGSDSAKARLK